MAYETRLGAGIRQLGDTDSYRMLRGKDLDITEATELTSLADADIFLVDDDAAGTQASTKKITASNLKSYINNNIGNAASATKVYVTDNEGTGENNLITFVANASTTSGNHDLEMDGDFHYNPGTGKVTATGFVGNLTGNADTVTTNANLTGHITSTGNTTSLGSFTLAQLNTAISDAALAENTNTMGSGFTVSATTDTNATTITQGDDLFFAAGTGISCETTADGTVTISNTLTSGISFSGSQSNGLLTYHDTSTATVESNLQFDQDVLTAISDVSLKPIIKLRNTHNSDIYPGELRFEKLRADNGVAQDQALGNIRFKGQNDSQQDQYYASITAFIDDSTDGEESGKLLFRVASHDGDLGDGLSLVGGSSNNEIDVNIGVGINSETNVSGNLTVNNSISVGGHSFNDIDIDSEHADSNNHIMSSKAIKNYVDTNASGATTIGGLTDVDTTNIATNDILVWDGSSFQVQSMTDLINNPTFYNFSWDQVYYNNNTSDVTDTTPSGSGGVSSHNILCGTGNHITSIVVTHTLSQSDSNDFVSGANGSDNLGLQTKDVNSSSFTAHQNLTYNNGSPTASHSINLPFPTSLSNAAYTISYIKTQFKYNNTPYEHELRYLYKNYLYLGKHTDDTPTNAELQDFPKKQFADNGTASNDIINAYGISLNGTSQHLQFWYPARITNDTPSFQVGESSTSLSGETWTEISATISHTNSAGFTETYKGYKSPNPLDNTGGVNTWYVKVTMS